jgi:dimethylglycine dehydrogenase
VSFAIKENGADAVGDEPVWSEGKVIGWITSGGYAHHLGRSLALGYVPAALAEEGADFEVEILGERRPAKLALAPPFDPQGRRMRS